MSELRQLTVKTGSPLITERLEEPAMEAYRNLGVRVETRLGVLAKASHVITVTSSEGSSGKTLTSLNLALTLAAQSAGRVLLVEGDLMRPSFGKYLGIPGNLPGFVQVLQGETTLGQSVSTVPSVGLHILHSGLQVASPDVLAAAPLRRFLYQVRESYDIVIFDSPPLFTSSGLRLAEVADLVLPVVRLSHTKKNDLEKLLMELGPSKVLGFVVNDDRAQMKQYAY